MDILKKKKYNLQELSQFLQLQKEFNETKATQQCRVLIIDDKVEDPLYPFKDQIDVLRKQYGCSITTKVDLDNVQDAQAYDFIICDREGVGKKICGPKGDGLALLKNLIKEYPGKSYVLYSDKDVNISRLAEFKRYHTVKMWSKNTLLDNEIYGGDGFVEHVRKSIEYVTNPLTRWKELRLKFLKNTDIDLSDLANLEHAYIKSIMTQDPKHYDKAIKELQGYSDSNAIIPYLKASKSIIEFAISVISII
ncbi:MAG: hypothetical protein K2H60_01795 [Muribaculaceae bacterium]|nr:hypothetical protein [Muribaculaceae bacterium]